VTRLLGTRTASQPGRGDRAPPRESPLVSSRAFHPKAPCLGLAWPWRGGLRTPGTKAHASPRHIPIGRRAFCPIIFGYRKPGAYEGSCTAGARSAPLRENRFSRDFRALPGWGPALRSASPRRGGLCTPAAKSLASSRDLPLDQGFSPAPWGKGNPSAFARPCHKAAGRGSLAAEPQCSSISYPGKIPCG